MTSQELRNALSSLGYSVIGFANKVGANERTVRRWVRNEQDIPPWVPVMIELMVQAHKSTHGPHYLEAHKAQVSFVAAFGAWVDLENPSPQDIEEEIAGAVSALCGAADIPDASGALFGGAAR